VMARRRILPRVAPVLLATAVLAASGGGAFAQPTVFGGVAFGSDELAYLGVTVPLNTSGTGLAVRGIASGSEYNYHSNGVKIDGRQVRGDVSLLAQTSTPNVYADVGIGARYIDTHLSPNDPFNPARNHWEAAVSASFQAQKDLWRVTGFSSYGFEQHDYFIRADLSRVVTRNVRLGVETLFDGDRTYDRRRFGLLAAYSTSPRWEAQVSIGGADSNTRNGAYGGISFRRNF
jgi:hypothetical protein